MSSVDPSLAAGVVTNADPVANAGRPGTSNVSGRPASAGELENGGLPAEARAWIAADGLEGEAVDLLVRWLATDRPLAARLLRWCNTPMFNLSSPFADLEQAVAIMEPREFGRLALLAYVRGLFLPDLQIDVYGRERLWRHSAAVAAAGSMIARVCGGGDPSLVLLAGGLHDLGICIGERHHAGAFASLLADVDELSPLHEIEQERFGWDHARLGAESLREWGLSEPLVEAVRFHHAAETGLDGPGDVTVACLAVANYLCSRRGWSSLGVHNLAVPSERVLGRLGIDRSLLTLLWRHLGPALEAAAALG